MLSPDTGSVRFVMHQAFLARLLQQFVHHLQGVGIELGVELGGAKYSEQTADHLFERMDGIRDQYCPHSRTADDNQFRRLHQNLERPVLHQIARQDATENHDDPNNRKHRTSSSQA